MIIKKCKTEDRPNLEGILEAYLQFWSDQENLNQT